jgi:quercetin dioxygenase-like cupin family protein
MGTTTKAEPTAAPNAGTIGRRDLIIRAAVVGVSLALVGDAVRGTRTAAHDAATYIITTTDPTVPAGGPAMASASEHYALADDAAETIWFLGTLALIKGTTSGTGNHLAAVEFTHPTGFATPLHVHHTADEAFYVLAGGMRGVCGEHEWRATTGSFVWLPRGIPHGYAVDGDETLRTLAITVPAGIDRFIVETGEPARERTLPLPAAPDIAKLEAVGTKYGIENVGPPVQFTDTPPA